ncbi:phosphatidylinositol 4,5-bisphosphate 3-kinase catalytic subunit gamma isoform-like [Leucoraja erinacea]|uniref:phosphatidylinositol 4,5-bisphosphate 3-kinase catalytic subunit gamma isoform-like n=1 Tax=Leucoraja erinaceus TaxID=7782 RepID=UPI002456D0E6|nr:phosphatidylinositol 4,5-bisphosphate 3-kinase catalytic subunit gamma isoform-like [Leucoraja erinacea]
MDQAEGAVNSAGPFTARGTLLLTCVLPTSCPSNSQSESLDLEMPTHSTVWTLRLLAWSQAAGHSATPSLYQLNSPHHFRLLYRKGPTWYEMLEDQHTLASLGAVRYWKSLGLKKGQIHLEPQPKETRSSQDFWNGLTNLVGLDVRSRVASQQSELNWARRMFAVVRQVDVQRRDGRAFAMEPCLVSSPLPQGLLPQVDREMAVTIYHAGTSRKMKVDLRYTPGEVVQAYREVTPPEVAPDLVLKVCGRQDYLTGCRPLVDFSWVRHCLKNKEEVHLALVEAPCAEEDGVDGVEWPLVDEATELTTGHQELDGEEPPIISLWDCHHRFRVKLLGLDLPAPPSDGPPAVYVEAAVLHGASVLSSVASPPRPLAQEMMWNVWLSLDIRVENLPRGSRLRLAVYGLDDQTLPSWDPRQSPREGNPGQGKAGHLHSVSLLLIDHHSLLRQGEYVLHMWPGSRDNQGADLLSSQTNPELVTSAAICILLDTYHRPVALPGQSDKESESSYFGQTSHGEKRDLLQRFREECGLYSRPLPIFLATVQWGDRSVVQEVHWLFHRWQPQQLDLAVALELLGADVADREVRKLAVRRLEGLDNDHLLRYLLQLVQVLKFEPYHDSSLARFLIGRALTSKRIGHFFFWYCRGEVMGSPSFSDRYSVTLEAYLLACGQTLLQDFQRQVHLASSLGHVATSLKAVIAEKGDVPSNAAALLHELLRQADLPQNVVAPYNPSLRVGRILVEQCKVLPSKKKPLWLEFTPADLSDPHGRPICIIFKQGDDLRQDMLVLQTLVIMDSIWQENSLDLNLTPYGCIATGYNMGMIEAVGDAMTIAAVQRLKGGNSGAFKNDALHDWLRSKLQVEEAYQQAMETFVTSCAGYCVATYVLGIGDRHNDNIMITERGNLFHVDFGHILGNRKRFLGLRRERVPFVLTPDMLFVMGRLNRRPSLYFQRFKDTCVQAYLSLRSHSSLLITLFSLMLRTGLPELSCARDVEYLREALAVGSETPAAHQHFLSCISECESLGWTVQANWWIHMWMGIKQA